MVDQQFAPAGLFILPGKSYPARAVRADRRNNFSTVQGAVAIPAATARVVSNVM
jgi:hypothetical protein